MTNRREFLRRAAEMSAALLLSIEKAAAIEPDPSSTFEDAEHVVILMQENRSFDHTFGALRGVRGFNDPRAVTLPNGDPVWKQSSKGKSYTPFRLDLHGTKVTWLGSLPHSWRDQTDARNHGNHDGWLDAKPSGRKECAGMPFTMGYFDRRDLPFYYALADAFTVCDQNFCSTLTGTTPNRLHLWTGTIRDGKGQQQVRNSDVTYSQTANWKTYPERLESAGVSWRVYQNELSLPSGLNNEEDAWLANFTDNPLEWFDQYHVGFRPGYLAYLKKAIADLPKAIEAASGNERQKRSLESRLAHYQREVAKWSTEPEARLTALDRNLHAKAFTTNVGDPDYRSLTTMKYKAEDGVEREMKVPKGDVLHQFRADVEQGKLPKVSWIVPPENFSDHPGAPWYGAWMVAEVMNILTAKPELWKKTIFVLCYDENDGYFDHVPPYVVPDPAMAETGKMTAGLEIGRAHV
jgi:phospholipase C